MKTEMVDRMITRVKESTGLQAIIAIVALALVYYFGRNTDTGKRIELFMENKAKEAGSLATDIWQKIFSKKGKEKATTEEAAKAK